MFKNIQKETGDKLHELSHAKFSMENCCWWNEGKRENEKSKMLLSINHWVEIQGKRKRNFKKYQLFKFKKTDAASSLLITIMCTNLVVGRSVYSTHAHTYTYAYFCMIFYGLRFVYGKQLNVSHVKYIVVYTLQCRTWTAPNNQMFERIRLKENRRTTWNKSKHPKRKTEKKNIHSGKRRKYVLKQIPWAKGMRREKKQQQHKKQQQYWNEWHQMNCVNVSAALHCCESHRSEVLNGIHCCKVPLLITSSILVAIAIFILGFRFNFEFLSLFNLCIMKIWLISRV